MSDNPPSSSPSDPTPPADEVSSSITPDTSLEPQRPSVRTMASSPTPLTANMTPSSTPLGNINAARRPPAVPTFQKRGSAVNMSSDLAARMKAFHLTRQGTPAHRPHGPQTESNAPSINTPTDSASTSTASGTPAPLTLTGTTMAMPGGIPAGFKLPNGGVSQHQNSAPAVPQAGARKLSLAEKRGLALPGGLPGAPAPPNGSASAAAAPKRKKPGFSLSQITGEEPAANGSSAGGSAIDKYSQYLDAKTGSLRFAGKAVLNSQGVQFASGSSYSISLDEVETLDELGKGNYGTVYKVRHSKPKIRRPGQGLSGNKLKNQDQLPPSPTIRNAEDAHQAEALKPTNASVTGVVMAMKEMRLELEDAKFASIVMELDILHKCISPYIVDFYGAFFQEGAVYICMEFMDGGSLDKLYGNGVPEGVLRKITYATVQGLKCLKDEHNIIHRDVKPTNILINSRGQVKICDFGVSGNLVASFAKTNIGCQSYMAPERISTGSMDPMANPGGGTYSVQSDIWSLGLTIIECALGKYPYPPETYNNIFSQLSAIVNGDPPDLPQEGFSDTARNFVHGCLNKIPKLRPTYAMLLQHAWLTPLSKPSAIVEEDEEAAERGEALPEPTVPDTSDAQINDPRLPSDAVDKEVGLWVIETVEKKRAGKLAKSVKPAGHAAPLDAVVSPAVEKTFEPVES